MKRISLIAICAFFIEALPAQQDPLYSQYLINPFILNPAYAGSTKDLTAQAAYRQQWAGFSGAPVTMNVTGHVRLADNKMGLGLILLQDKVGSNKTTEAQAAYSYHVKLSENKRLSFGLQAGVVNYQNDYSELTIDRGDPKFQSNLSEFIPTFGAGIMFTVDRFFISLSVPKMLKSTTSLDGNELVLYNQHAYGHIMYLFNLSHRLKLKPFALVRYVEGASINTDFGAILNADDSYMLGAFTRNLQAYGLLAKIHLGDNLRVGYVFEMPTNKSVGINYTTHEITVGFRMRFLRFHDIDSIVDF